MPNRNTIEPTAKEVIRDNKKYLFALAILVLLLIMTALLIVAAKDSNISSNSAVVDRELKTDLNAVAHSNKGLESQWSEGKRVMITGMNSLMLSPPLLITSELTLISQYHPTLKKNLDFFPKNTKRNSAIYAYFVN